jgi:hypothetical protein
MLLKNDFVKLGLIVVGAVVLFQVLSRYNILQNEGYDGSAQALMPTYGSLMPSGSLTSMNSLPYVSPTASVAAPAAISPTSMPPLAPVQAMDDIPVGGLAGTYADKPKECFPKDVLDAEDLLPKDQYSKWAAVNPDGQGNLKDRNFLAAGYNIGINTQGQSLRNASHDLRSTPPNAVLKVSPWMNSTIEPDLNRRPFEIGGSC